MEMYYVPAGFVSLYHRAVQLLRKATPYGIQIFVLLYFCYVLLSQERIVSENTEYRELKSPAFKCIIDMFLCRDPKQGN